MSTDLGIDWDQTRFPKETADDAAKIVEESVLAQRRALSGFKGDGRIDRELFLQAMRPKHAAISLEGEVTMYPWIDLLVEEYFSHGFKTVILVTNGLNPDTLRRMRREPSQLYISLSAPNRETYGKVCRPLIQDGWERLQETLSLLKEFSCPTVLRLTLVKGLNITDPEAYADAILKTEPTYVEPKAAMAVGFFLERLPRDAMPDHGDIQNFATQLSDLTGYRILDEFSPSGVVLLSRLRNPKKLV
jgi:tRNA wybutosine-synthesizing protein 1